MPAVHASPALPLAAAPVRSRTARLLPTAAGAIAVLATIVGFHHFYFAGSSYPGRPITPPIRGLVITHGVVMTAWILLSLVQPALVALGHRRVHQRLGRFGALLALGAVGTGLVIAVQSARVAPPDARIWGVTAAQFMAVPLSAACVFALFVAIGLWHRRTPAIHRPMMLLATYSALSAAISRIDVLSNLYLGTVWEGLFGPFFLTQVLLGLLLAVDCLCRRALDGRFAAGFALMTLGYAAVWQVAQTHAWDGVASALVR